MEKILLVICPRRMTSLFLNAGMGCEFGCDVGTVIEYVGCAGSTVYGYGQVVPGTEVNTPVLVLEMAATDPSPDSKEMRRSVVP